jgi:hypothetical protein
LLLTERLQIRLCSLEKGRIVLVAAKADVAIPAKQTPDRVGRVAVIDVKRLVEFSVADRAETALLSEHGFVFLHGYAIGQFQVRLALNFDAAGICFTPKFAIQRPPPALLFVDLVPVRRTVAAITLATSFSIGWILTVALPSLLAPDRHAFCDVLHARGGNS